MDMLHRIINERLQDARESERVVPLVELQKRAEARVHRSLTRMIAAENGPAIIAEMKAASPSAGTLCRTYEPAVLGKKYEEGGAVGISVLTEPRYFLGRDEHISQVRKVVNIPILRKDFIGCEYQVWETAAIGADVLLLIVAALDMRLLKDLYSIARVCGLDVIAEAHTAEELIAASQLPDAIIGVNSRDLRTLKTDLNVLRGIASMLPPGRLVIAESGISLPGQVKEFYSLGYKGFLVGETLMRSLDPAAEVRLLRRSCG